MTGYGVFTWSSGASYQGYFENDIKEGQGKMTFANGDVYEGQFKNDLRHGNGHYTWKDGTYYSGTFRNNLMDTRVLDENGNFILGEDGAYVHGNVGYYTTILSPEEHKTYRGYFEAGKIVAVYEDTEE